MFIAVCVSAGAEDIFYVFVCAPAAIAASFSLWSTRHACTRRRHLSLALGSSFDCYHVKTLLTMYKICAEDSRNVTFKVFSR